MKQLLITIAVVVLVGCGESQQSAITPEAKPVAEAAKPEPTRAKAPDITIHKAVKIGNIAAVKQHLAAGTDVNTNDEDGETPLYRAAYHGYMEIAKLLIAEGADVNTKSDWLNTPLHDAASEGRNEIVELLIAKGANVNAKNKGEVTPLDLAVYYGQKETANLLRKLGGKTTGNLIPNTSGVQSLF